MSLSDAFRYDGKRALVVGGATGRARRPPSWSRTPEPRSS